MISCGCPLAMLAHRRPRTTTSSSNLRNGGDESGWAPVISSPEGRGALDEQTPESSSRVVNRRAMISPWVCSPSARRVTHFVSTSQPPHDDLPRVSSPSARRVRFVSTRRSDSWKVGAEVRSHDGCRDDNLTHKWVTLPRVSPFDQRWGRVCDTNG